MEVKSFENLKYLIRYPKGYKEGEKYPIILFLHGAGTRGDNISVLENNCVFSITEKYESFPFIMIAPQCNLNTWFDHFETLRRFVRMIAESGFSDEARIYVMGNSMGGYATWQLATSMPEYFAAAVPICGGGMYWNAARLVNLPVWAFHGEDDSVVFCEESKKMVDALIRAGGEAKLTLYPNTNHDSWTATYKNPEVFEWLLSKKKGGSALGDDKFSDSKIYG